MNSPNQSFVQAFSRRAKGQGPHFDNENLNQSDVENSQETISPTESSGIYPAMTEVQHQSVYDLEINDSIADSASVWIDQDDGLVARIDKGTHPLNADCEGNSNMLVNRPGENHSHKRLQEEEVSTDGINEEAESFLSMQHTFTAYAESTVSLERINQCSQLNDLNTDNQVDSLDHEELQGSTQSVTQTSEFEAAWEVEQFKIPPHVESLFNDNELSEELSARLLEAVRSGLNSLLVTSVGPREGKTTVALGLAASAAKAGLKVAIVDGHLDSPSLADTLRLEIDCGWESLSPLIPVSEIAVQSLKDQCTIFPYLRSSDSKHTYEHGYQTLLETITRQFDLVIIDGPSVSNFLQHFDVQTIDSAVIVRDVRLGNFGAVREWSTQLSVAGLKSIGVVENHL
ncbi:MAG: hypothetical protein VXZ38_13330 [Planctomycetota bacterium]|nr:hypothetical protein [Planctomycetota bacterium]